MSLEDDFKDLKIGDTYDVNIVLLGGKGVGKSTFINSIANYLYYPNLEEAMQNELFYLTPCIFNITDKHFVPQKVTYGLDDDDDANNEYHLIGDSATQDITTHVFPIGTGKTRLRFIDTPGMEDPKRVDQDDMNFENIFTYLNQLHHLHAICLIFKPNDDVANTFEYCLKRIFSRLDKSIAKNIILVFTNCRNQPKESISCLKKIAAEIKKKPPHFDVKLDNNVFCFDNGAFRFLAAEKYGIEFDEVIKEEYHKIWKNLSQDAWKLFKYIVGGVDRDPLTPYVLRASSSVNEARRLINQLIQPLAEITELILDNLNILDRRLKGLQDKDISLDELREKLYIPVIKMEVINLKEPAIICCSRKCVDMIPIEGRTTWNYKQRCHLTIASKEIKGATLLDQCSAMESNNQVCKICRCRMTFHMHTYYMTKKFDDRQSDLSVQDQITTFEEGLVKKDIIINKILETKSELEFEKDLITGCAAKFANFLKKSSIAQFTDSYRKYINYMLLREQSLDTDTDDITIQQFIVLLKKYDQFKMEFEELMESSEDLEYIGEIEAKDIRSQLDKLYSLEHSGKMIRELYSTQKAARIKEYQETENIHSAPGKEPLKHSNEQQPQTKTNGKKKKQKKASKNQNPQEAPKNKTNQENINKNRSQSTEKINKTLTSIVSDTDGLKKQIKIEINEITNQPQVNVKAKKNNPNEGKKFGKPKPAQPKPAQPKPAQPKSAKPKSAQPNSAQYKSAQPKQTLTQSDAQNHNQYNTQVNSRTKQDSRPIFDSPPPYDNRAAYGSPQAYENRPPCGNAQPYENRPPYSNAQPYENRPPYSNPQPYENRPPYSNAQPYENRPTYSNPQPYENRPPYSNPQPYENRPHYGNPQPSENCPPYTNPKSNENRHNPPPPYSKVSNRSNNNNKNPNKNKKQGRQHQDKRDHSRNTRSEKSDECNLM